MIEKKVLFPRILICLEYSKVCAVAPLNSCKQCWTFIVITAFVQSNCIDSINWAHGVWWQKSKSGIEFRVKLLEVHVFLGTLFYRKFAHFLSCFEITVTDRPHKCHLMLAKWYQSILHLLLSVMGKSQIRFHTQISYLFRKLIKSFSLISSPHFSSNPKSFKSNLKWNLKSFVKISAFIHLQQEVNILF